MVEYGMDCIIFCRGHVLRLQPELAVPPVQIVVVLIEQPHQQVLVQDLLSGRPHSTSHTGQR